MQVKVKTLDQKQFTIEIEDSDTIENVKSKIHIAKDKSPTLDPSVSKLIWKGKILTNEKLAKDCGVNDKGFFVVMPGKAPQQATTSTATASSKTEDEKKKEEENKQEEPAATTDAAATQQTAVIAPPAVNPATPPAAPASTATASDALSRLPQIELSDELIANVSAITGVPMDRVKLALTVAQGNPDNAVELLLSGQLDRVIREITQNRGGAQQQASSGSEQQTTPETNSSSASEQTNNPLGYLRNDPQFSQVINAIRQNPTLLPQVLQQISQSNPSLFQELQSNHEAFLQLLEDSETDTAHTSQAPTNQQPGAATGQPAQQRIELSITPEDRAAIDRLMALGFSEIEAVQAYMACDKNEQLAANFLFDS